MLLYLSSRKGNFSPFSLKLRSVTLPAFSAKIFSLKRLSFQAKISIFDVSSLQIRASLNPPILIFPLFPSLPTARFPPNYSLFPPSHLSDNGKFIIMKAVLLLCVLLLCLHSNAVSLQDKLKNTERAPATYIPKDSFIQAFMRAEGMITAAQLTLLGDSDDQDDATGR